MINYNKITLIIILYFATICLCDYDSTYSITIDNNNSNIYDNCISLDSPDYDNLPYFVIFYVGSDNFRCTDNIANMVSELDQLYYAWYMVYSPYVDIINDYDITCTSDDISNKTFDCICVGNVFVQIDLESIPDYINNSCQLNALFDALDDKHSDIMTSNGNTVVYRSLNNLMLILTIIVALMII